MRFDPSIVAVKQSSIVSQIVSSPVVRAWFRQSVVCTVPVISGVCSKLVNQLSKVSR